LIYKSDKIFVRALYCLWIATIIIFIFLLIDPVKTNTLKTAEFLLILFLIFIPAYLFRKSKKIILIIFLIFIIPIFLFSVSLKEYNMDSLKNAYVKSLCSYEETRYIWGGENNIGIDCSGLVRRAFIDALVREGIFNFNGVLLRNAVKIWWQDAAARDLFAGYDGRLIEVATAQSINSFDNSLLQPGDIAVTSTGRHTLAYLGHNQWIEADPTIGKVIKVTIPDNKNGWFKIPVKILRWKLLKK